MRIPVVRPCGLRFGLAGLAFLTVLTGDSVAPARASEPMNACGCYRDDQGVCKCTRKSKCGCPEECEPVGCEAKRQREADREAEAALKQIAARERKKASEAAAEAAEKTKAAKKAAAGATRASKREKALEKAMREAAEPDKRDRPTPPRADPLAQ